MIVVLVGLLCLTAAPPDPHVTPIHLGDAGTVRARKVDQPSAVTAAKKALVDRKVDTSKLDLDLPTVKIVADGAVYEVTFNPKIPVSKGGVVIVRIDGESGEPQIAFAQ